MLRSIATILGPIVLAAVATLTAGCSSAPEEEQTDQGALTEVDTFKVDVHSAKEAAGEVDTGNAYAMARLARLAYEFTDKASLDAKLRELGVESEETIEFHAANGFNILRTRATTGTDGFYLRTKEAGFLVFRGSEPGSIADIIADARVLPAFAGPKANRAGKGTVHAGFYNAVETVWKEVREYIKDRHGDGQLPLYVVGHSLGGALATIATHHLTFDGCLHDLGHSIDVLGICESHYVPVRALYTFGSPRTGDEKYATNLFDRLKEVKTSHFRFVNEEDGVTMVPQTTMMPGFRHISDDSNEAATGIFLSRDAKMTVNRQNACPESKVPLVQCDNSLIDAIAGAFKGTPPWKGEHPMMIYREKLKIIATGKGDLEKARADAIAAASATRGQ